MEVVLPKPGKYVLAVSGGVDSVTLLDMLSKQSGLELVIVHFDHGIRADSRKDRQFVQAMAKRYGLPFEFEEGRLGQGASEAQARKHRYEFLGSLQEKHQADAIITAHHQDDLLETAILNMLRGTGRKGITALKSRPGILRPLLAVPKSELIAYAKQHQLQWREDDTNENQAYLRNYIRHKLLPQFSSSDRHKLINLVTNLKVVNDELDSLLAQQIKNNKIRRQWFDQLPHQVAREVMASWLRANDIRDFDRQTLERLVVAAKTGRAGQQFPAIGGHALRVGKHDLALK